MLSKMSPYINILLSALCFSIMSVVGNILSSQLNWIEVAYFRILPTFLLTVLISLFYSGRVLVFKSKSLWYRSIFGTIALMCTFYSLSKLPASEAVTLSATTPVWISLIMVLVFSERNSLVLWFFIIMAISGVYIMEMPKFNERSLVILVALSGALFTGLAMISLSFCGDITPITVVSHYSIVSFVTLQILFILSNGMIYVGVLSLLRQHFVPLVILGIAGTSGQILLTMAYGTGKPQWVSTVGLSQVFFTTTLELILKRIDISLNLLIGMLIIIISVIGVVWNRYSTDKCSNSG